MGQEIHYPELVPNRDKRTSAAKTIILGAATRNGAIEYVGAMGSFWLGGKSPADIDLLVVVADSNFDPQEIISPLGVFNLRVDLQLADPWVTTIKNQVPTLKVLMKKGIDIYGIKPEWLR